MQGISTSRTANEMIPGKVELQIMQGNTSSRIIIAN